MVYLNLSGTAGADAGHNAVRQFVSSLLVLFGFALVFGVAGPAQYAKGAVSRGDKRWNIVASVPLPCACWQAGLGYDVSDYATVGVSGYNGAGFVFSPVETKQVGGYVQVKPFAESLYLQLSAGHMSTSEEVDFLGIKSREDDSGAFWGAAIGNTWRLGRRWTHGIVWYGKDFYFKRSEVEPLGHLLRYQFGFRF